MKAAAATGNIPADILVSRFIGICREHQQGELEGDFARLRRLYDEIEAIRIELKSRPGDQRRALIPLLHHANAQVRLKAAKSLLAIVPEEAKQSLEALAASRIFPEAGDAGMSLWNLDQGIWKPT